MDVAGGGGEGEDHGLFFDKGEGLGVDGVEGWGARGS